MSTINKLIVASLRAAGTYQQHIADLAAELHRTGVDLTDRDSVRAALLPGVCDVYRKSHGIGEDNKLTREMDAPRQALSRLIKAVQNVAGVVNHKATVQKRVPRELQAQVNALLQAYDAALIREAIKRAA
jgi:hypothetical protein